MTTEQSERLTEAQRGVLETFRRRPNQPAFVKEVEQQSLLDALWLRGLLRFQLGDFIITDKGRAALNSSSKGGSEKT